MIQFHDDPSPNFIVHQVWSTAELPNLSESSLAGGLRRRPQRIKLDSDRFGGKAGDQTRGLIESCTRLNFSIGLVFSEYMTIILFEREIDVVSCSTRHHRGCDRASGKFSFTANKGQGG